MSVSARTAGHYYGLASLLLLLWLLLLAAVGRGGPHATTADAFVLPPSPSSTVRSRQRSAPTMTSAAGPNPPGPRSLPLVGSMVSLLVRGGNFDRYDAWAQRKYGPVVVSSLLGERWYTISAPELAVEVNLSREDIYIKYVPRPLTQAWGNTGIIFASGPEQTLNRRLSSPAFVNTDFLECTHATVLDLAEHLARRYAAEGLAPGNSAGIVDLWASIKCLTLEATTQAGFSLPLGLLDEQAAVGSKYDGQRIVALLKAVSDEIMPAGFTPILPPRLNPAFRRLKSAWGALVEEEERIVRDRRAARAAAAAAKGAVPAARDLLDVYLVAEEAKGEGQLSTEQMLKNIFDVFLGGSDTTASSICATMYEVVSNPRILARVRAELQALDLTDPAHRTISGMAARLPYLDLCIKETLRLYPSLSFTLRRAARDTALGGHFVPKGGVVATSITNLHRDPAIWGPDVGEFRPERWEEGPGGLESTLPKGAYIPFGMGTRVCLGLRLSLLETRAVVAVLLKRLDWAPASQARSRRRRVAAVLRGALGRQGTEKKNKVGEELVERLRVTYPGAAAFPDGVRLSVKGWRPG